MKVDNMSKQEWCDVGVHYAMKSWSSTFNRLGSKNLYKRIEKFALGMIAEISVEQYLKGRFDLDLRQEDRYDIIDYNSGNTKDYSDQLSFYSEAKRIQQLP